MKRFQGLILVLLFGSVVFTVVAEAAPIGYSVSTTGSKTITSDTGLEWLALTYTDGMSYNAIVQDVTSNGTGSIYYGYQRATDIQFYDLIDDYGLPDTGWTWDLAVTASVLTTAEEFQEDFGLTWEYTGVDQEFKYSYGALIRAADSVQTLALVGDETTRDNSGQITQREGLYSVFGIGWGTNSSVDGTVGQWLVRQAAPVPEPATVALLGIGLVGLAAVEVRRRRKKKAIGKS